MSAQTKVREVGEHIRLENPGDMHVETSIQNHLMHRGRILDSDLDLDFGFPWRPTYANSVYQSAQQPQLRPFRYHHAGRTSSALAPTPMLSGVYIEQARPQVLACVQCSHEQPGPV